MQRPDVAYKSADVKTPWCVSWDWIYFPEKKVFLNYLQNSQENARNGVFLFNKV